MPTVTMNGQALAPFAVLVLVSASCARAPVEPRSTPPLAMVAPGERLLKASLFGTDVVGLPSGTTMTPDAAPGSTLLELDPHIPSLPAFRAGNAVSMALSPDGSTLLALTSGYNRTFDADGKMVEVGSSEWVFVYDVSHGAPRETQVIAVHNTFGGLVWSPAGGRFFVSGGADDLVREYRVDASGRYSEAGEPVRLGHGTKGGGGLGIQQDPYAAGLAITPSGGRLVVANNENDSVSVLDIEAHRVLFEIPLRPGGGVAGGEFPYGVVTTSESRAFVTSERDHEIVEVDLDAGRVSRRIRVGSSPITLAKNRASTRLYVANANSDTISVVDVARGEVIASIDTSPLAARPGGHKLAGANPNWVSLSPDQSSLYVSVGGNNAIAVIALSPRDRGEGGVSAGSSGVAGFVPTGDYPHSVIASADGQFVYVAFGKSPTGPNPLGPWSATERSKDNPYTPSLGNQFTLQLKHGGVHAFPTPSAEALAKLTVQVRINNRFVQEATTPAVFSSLRGVVKHVIYVIGENRSYDQILGDVKGADGDTRLVHWGASITPNQHALATGFVTLDRFFDSGGVSGDGWMWSTAGRTSDIAEKVIPVEYAGRGEHSYDWDGTNRNINVGIKDEDEREKANPESPHAPDLLPGTADVGDVEDTESGGTGRLWDAALRAGKTVRNYGFFEDGARYFAKKTDAWYLPPIPFPYAEKMRVAYPTRPALMAVTDPYYRSFDLRLADYWREKEWEREFDGYVADDDLPSLELVWLPHDHLGSFKTALDGVNTPDTQIADHDYALGLMVERLSRSPFWKDTVLVALEDDAQNGSDHVDAQRSVIFFAGGHVRRGGAVVSSVYTTPSVLRTIELLLGLPPLGQTDAFAPPMSDVLQTTVDMTAFRAAVPAVLRSTELPLPPSATASMALPRGDASSWALATEGYDFEHADAAPASEMSHLLYCRLVVGARCSTESSAHAAP